MRVPLLLLAAAIATPAASQSPPKNMTFSTALKSVAVFRDGFGYYVREGKAKLENGWATTDLMPAAIKGTVWFYSLDKGDKIDTVVLSRENKIAFGTPAEIESKLADKIGLKIVVETKGGQKFEGELAKILDDMLLLKIGDAFNAVPYDQAQSISFSGFPVRIKVDTKDPNKVVTLGVAYLQEGIRWEPSYVLDVKKGVGDLSLRATMLNTTERLSNTDVFFVVGSPFVANRGIQDLVAQLPGADKAAGGVAAQAAAEKPQDAPVVKAALARDEAGELYYYRKPGLSLATNDVAMLAVFSATVPVTPRYEWDADGDDVSYLLSFLNKSGQPLTTGPVLVLEDGKAIGQETVRYTPAGGTAEVRLARGIGLKVERLEVETKRSGNVKVGRTEYIPVTLKGTLTVTNFRTEAAPLTITKTVRGKVLTPGEYGKVAQTQILNGEPNPINDLEWKLEIPAGATRTIVYTYETFMSAERAGAPPVPSGPEDDAR